MRIATNVNALNSWRNLTITNNSLGKTLEKLSSGYRINRAADDAAGLAISEKMRGQIRGLNMAVKNAQDGISLIQTAEGAMNEAHAILQRMRELAVQSASDTNTDTDRAEIQKEVDQLAAELTRIAETTEFNTNKLLDGSLQDVVFHIGANEGQNITLSVSDMSAAALKVAGNQGAEFAVPGTVADSTNTSSAFVSGSTATYAVMSYEEYTQTGGPAIDVTESASTSLTDIQYVLVDSTGAAIATSEDAKRYDELAADADDRGSITFNNTVTSGDVTITGAAGAGEASGTATIEEHELGADTYTVVDVTSNPSISGVWNVGLADSSGKIVALGATDAAGAAAGSAGLVTHWVSSSDYTEVLLQQTAESTLAVGSEITVTGAGIDVSGQTSADAAITVINDALEMVSAERSKLGALQNRLDHTINNLSVAAENLSAAESRIRDVDMALEMANFTRNQILVQAGTAMLAQANAAPQSVLQLLG